MQGGGRPLTQGWIPTWNGDGQRGGEQESAGQVAIFAIIHDPVFTGAGGRGRVMNHIVPWACEGQCIDGFDCADVKLRCVLACFCMFVSLGSADSAHLGDVQRQDNEWLLQDPQRPWRCRDHLLRHDSGMYAVMRLEWCVGWSVKFLTDFFR